MKSSFFFKKYGRMWASQIILEITGKKGYKDPFLLFLKSHLDSWQHFSGFSQVSFIFSLLCPKKSNPKEHTLSPIIYSRIWMLLDLNIAWCSEKSQYFNIIMSPWCGWPCDLSRKPGAGSATVCRSQVPRFHWPVPWPRAGHQLLPSSWKRFFDQLSYRVVRAELQEELVVM